MTTDIPTEIIDKHESKQPLWKSKWLWLTVIPPYIYFSGYSYFKGKMTALGFPEAQINASIGEVYLQAYEAFSIMTGSMFHYALKNFFSVFQSILVYSIFGAAVILLLILYRHYKPSRLVKWQLKMKEFSSHTEGGKPTIGKAFYLSALSIGIFALLLVGIYVLINAAIITAFIALSMSGTIGKQYAEELLSKPVCVTLKEAQETAKTSYTMGCAKLLMTDGKEVIGRVVYRDESFLYVVTNDSTISIPTDTVVLNTREIQRK